MPSFPHRFLTVIVAYLFFGFIYNRFILGAKGMEQFPNISFWRDFGNLEAVSGILMTIEHSY